MHFALVAVPLVLAAGGDGTVQMQVVPSEIRTVATTPMTFVLEKSVVRGNTLQIWGEVKNDTGWTFRFVRLIATARDAGDRFLGRNDWSVEPGTVGPGMAGYVNGATIQCDGGVPETLEYSVLADRLPTGNGGGPEP